MSTPQVASRQLHTLGSLKNCTKGCLSHCLFNYKFSCHKHKHQRPSGLSLFEQKTNFSSLSLTSFLPIHPLFFCLLAVSHPTPPSPPTPKLSFRWQNSKAQSAGFEPEFSKSKAFLFLLAIVRGGCQQSPHFLLLNVCKSIKDCLCIQTASNESCSKEHLNEGCSLKQPA